ncbi:hypothetical protein Efla_004366 [Eimeria flavescens]
MADLFSSALRLGGLDDYLNPAQDCVLPLLQAVDQQEKQQTADASGATSSQRRQKRIAGRRGAQQGVDAGKPEPATAAPTAADVQSVNEEGGAEGPPAAPPASAAAAPSSAETGEGNTAASPAAAVKRVGKIALSDCLSCSGCLTSAEGILLSQQSANEFFTLVSRKRRPGKGISPPQQLSEAESEPVKPPQVVAISLSSQCIASVALYFGCSPVVAAGRLSYLFRLLGADFVFSMAAAEDLALLETHKEFAGRLYRHQQEMDGEPQEGQASGATPAQQTAVATLLSSSGPLPLITSYCPGLVLYAEKSLEAPMLSFLSRVRSAQQIQGLLCKSAVRAAVEAVSFSLALKAHAWPPSPAACSPPGEAPEPAVFNRTSGRGAGAPWELLRSLLARSSYAYYTAAAAAGAAAVSRRVGEDPFGGSPSAESYRPDTAEKADLMDSSAAAKGGGSTTQSTSSLLAAKPLTDAEYAVERQAGGLLPNEILHVCVMPCFDKKLESARHDFTHVREDEEQQQADKESRGASFFNSVLAFGNPQGPWAEVDMVLATSELPILLEAAAVSFQTLPCASLDCIVPGTALCLAAHSLRQAASHARAAMAASLESQRNRETPKAHCEAAVATIAASVQPAEEAAEEAEKAAKAVPPFPHLRMHERRESKGDLTNVARPTAVLSGSGGYLEYLFLQTARGFFGEEILPYGVEFVKGPNEELQSLAVFSKRPILKPGTEGMAGTTGPPRGRRRGLWTNNTPALLRGAFAYGFRNIQNVAQQLRVLLGQETQATQPTQSEIKEAGSEDKSTGLALKREVGSSIPHIVEVGACPGGCLNGGGQTINVEAVNPQAHPSAVTGGHATGLSVSCEGQNSVDTGAAYEPKIIGKNREPLTSMTRLFHKEFPLLSPQAHPLVLPAYVFLFGCSYGAECGPAATVALGEYESMLRNEATRQTLQRLLGGEQSPLLPLRLWLAPRVTALFRTDFRPAKVTGKSGIAMSLADLKCLLAVCNLRHRGRCKSSTHRARLSANDGMRFALPPLACWPNFQRPTTQSGKLMKRIPISVKRGRA